MIARILARLGLDEARRARVRELVDLTLEARRRSRVLTVLFLKHPSGVPDAELRKAGLCDLAAGGHFYAEAVIDRPFPGDPFLEILGGWRCACGKIGQYRGTDADQRRRFDPLENARAAARIRPQLWEGSPAEDAPRSSS